MNFLPKNTFICCVKSGAFKALSRGTSKVVCLALGVGALFTGLTSTVSASPIVVSQQNSNFNTRAGVSPRQLENRNLSKDYSSILSETKTISETKPISLNQNSSTPLIQISPEILDLIKKIEINTGGSSLDSDQLLKLRYNMNSR